MLMSGYIKCLVAVLCAAKYDRVEVDFPDGISLIKGVDQTYQDLQDL